MKKMVFAAFVSLVGFSSQAQNSLANTTWAGTMNVPSPASAELVFKNDTLDVMMQESSIETMLYTVTGDTLSITKLYGSSPCGEEKATYLIKIKDNRLILTPQNDPCDLRAAAFVAEGYLRKP